MGKKQIEIDECEFCSREDVYVVTACDDCGAFACPNCQVVTSVTIEKTTNGETTQAAKTVIQCPTHGAAKKVKKSTLDQVVGDAISEA